MTTAEVAGTDGYAAFRYRNFTLHCAARFIMGIGLSMQVVAIGWYIYDVTNSALALGLSGLATFLPPAIFALFTGHVADTYNRRLIVTTAFSVYAICSLGLLLLVLNKSSQVWLIYGLIFIGSTGRAFSNPASQALTPNTVPKELFANAVTWYSAAWSASRIVGPAIGGILYVFGAAVPFFLIFIAFVTATFCVWSISISGMEDRKGGRGPISMETLLAGLRFIFTHKVLLGSISLDLVAVLFGGATALLPIVAKDVLHTDAWGLGLLRASPAVGAIAMSFWLARHPILGGAGRKMLIAVGCYGLATVVFGFSTNLILCMAMLALVGASDQVSVVIRHTMVQAETPDDMRGRVAAVNSVFISGSSDLGEFRAGATAEVFGATAAIASGGAMTFLFAALWGALFPDLKNRDKLVER